MAKSRTADSITPQEAIDRIEAVAHLRPHDRRLHARGAIYDARFVPSGQLSGLTTVQHLLTETPAVIRFSNGAPDHAPDDRANGIRGMAVKFLDGGDGITDLVAASVSTFPSRTPEGFVELIEILAGLKGRPVERLKSLAKLGAFAVRHPESRSALTRFVRHKAPASFACARYDGLHAFVLIDDKGERRPFRYRLVPQLGEVELSKESAASLPHDFLIAELDDRLKAGPVVFTLVFQFAESNDPINDASRAWPEDRPLRAAGQFIITGRSPNEIHWQNSVFDPTRLPPGIEGSDDPVLAFRPRAYAISATRRLGT